MRDIKTLAMQAKNRLRGLGGVGVTKGLRLVDEKSPIKFVTCEDDSEKIYEKFKDVVVSDEIHNPIGCMMDKKLYSQLCQTKKEQYFFDTLEKYQRLRERCCKEQNQNIDTFVG